MKKLILIGFLFAMNLGAEIFESDLNLQCEGKFNTLDSSGDTVAFIKIDKGESWDCEGGKTCSKDGTPGEFNVTNISTLDKVLFSDGTVGTRCYIKKNEINCKRALESMDKVLKINNTMTLNRNTGFVNYDETIILDGQVQRNGFRGICKLAKQERKF